jgi:hypothetical protein
LHYEDLRDKKCNFLGFGREYVYSLALRCRGDFKRTQVVGIVQETIKEIPAANVYIVNYEFVDLLIDRIIGNLNSCNVSDCTIQKLDYYLEYFYTFGENLDEIGALLDNKLYRLDQNLLLDETESGRIKAVLTALNKRLNGEIENG